MRCFISIELPDEIISEIIRIQENLRSQNLFFGKMTPKENLHLTLKFLGEIDKTMLFLIKERLCKVLFKKFNVVLGDIGVFSQSQVSIIWIKLCGEGLMKLQKDIDDCLSDILNIENRFMSHITIARVKSVESRKILLDSLDKTYITPVSSEISSFFLNDSVLTHQVPQYHIIEKYQSVD